MKLTNHCPTPLATELRLTTFTDGTEPGDAHVNTFGHQREIPAVIQRPRHHANAFT